MVFDRRASVMAAHGGWVSWRRGWPQSQRSPRYVALAFNGGLLRIFFFRVVAPLVRGPPGRPGEAREVMTVPEAGAARRDAYRRPRCR